MKTQAPPIDWNFWGVLIVAALLVIPRSVLITRALSPTMDEQFHLRRGLFYLTGEPRGLKLMTVDGMVGQAVVALPMVISGSTMAERIHAENMPMGWKRAGAIENARQRFAEMGRADVLFGHALSPDQLRMRIAIWKGILFVPFVGLVFYWVRWLYGLAAGWLAAGMVIIEPSFAGHIPLATLDVLSAETIVLACFAIWVWVREPNWWKLILASLASAVALMTKQTAVMMPVIALGYVVIWRKREGESRREIFNRLAGFFLLFVLFIWAFTKFDVSRPSEFIDAVPAAAQGRFAPVTDMFYAALQHPWPGGQYLAAFINSVRVDMGGRWAFLLGQARVGGWWYYYPVLLGFKVPLGFFVIFLLAIISLWRRAAFFDEWSIVLPAILCGGLFLTSRVNIGIRHFLPEYVFILMLGSRALVSVGGEMVHWMIGVVATLSLGWSTPSAGEFYPDFLSFVNWPYEKPWMLMNDSNVDWGQGLKETREWIDGHPTGGRPIYIRYDWEPVWVDYYLRGRAKRVTEFEAVPRHGILIICPVWVAGYWDPGDAYGFLREYQPTDIIGHSMLVYDLDHLGKAPRMQQ